MALTIIAVLTSLLVSTVSAAADLPAFSHAHSQGHIDSSHLYDDSGLAASRKFPGILYSHNDHGGHPRLFAIRESNAHVVAILNIVNAHNWDWEDIAVGPCAKGDDRSCIYISDDGDDEKRRTVYRVVEPDTMRHQDLQVDSVLKYNWTEPGTKCIMVDPDANIFIIGSVVGGRGMIVNLPSLAWGQSQPVYVESQSYLGVDSNYIDLNGGDISPDGTEVIIKTVHRVYYWSVPDRDYLAALTHKGRILPHHQDHKGQGLCFSADGNAYYTVAEDRYASLYKYTRL